MALEGKKGIAWRVMLASSAMALAATPALAQYGSPAGGLLGTIFNGIAQQQREQAFQQQQAARASQQQQLEAQRQAAMAQAQAQAAARQEEFERQQTVLRQQAAMRAKHDAEVREASRRAAAAKEESERLAAAEKAKVAAAAAEDARQAALAREKANAIEAQKVVDQIKTAQTVAENSPDNHCKEQSFAKVVLDNFNKFKIMNRLDKQVIDIEHLTTDKYDEKTTAMVCHGTFLLDDGSELPGNFEIRKNVAGNLIYLWSPDALDDGRAHMMALNAGPMRDMQLITGTGKQDAPRMVVIPASN